MFMSIKIDVIFVDQENRICALYESLSKWLPMIRSGKAITVIELPVGTIKKTKSEINDVITIKTESLDKALVDLLKNKVLNNTETILPFSEKLR